MDFWRLSNLTRVPRIDDNPPMHSIQTATRILKAALLTVVIAVVFAPTASAKWLTAPACKAHTKAKKGCFPRYITGDFSGEDEWSTWTGSVNLKRHRERNSYEYSGRAAIKWAHKPESTPGCTENPASGTAKTNVYMSIARYRAPGTRFFYNGSSPGFQIGEVQTSCTDGYGAPRLSAIESMFIFESKTLRLNRFSGHTSGKPTGVWDLAGYN